MLVAGDGQPINQNIFKNQQLDRLTFNDKKWQINKNQFEIHGNYIYRYNVN